MKLKFGGPNLPDNATTFYRHVNPDGQFVGNVNVNPGDVVDIERFYLKDEPQDFVDRGMATFLESEGQG